MSTHRLLELFLQGVTNKENRCDEWDDPDALCEWEGITMNGSGKITEIE
eukprot:CAMPEP_0201537654 /NCGR_PEP_ID=MMETSP0161_2-20130828/65398_1 /ASSEMBLY_ACC=CAM_ASM_000251 /TAXON_ID=180227 /ORGANISM="Neoparamoeba aestuarina, Strain SoJaBio B1-5/56/2" /LENGTH=48 /DNA_ID= /DNA_START= /DNA_END= /DNA_ORIENTATION=